MRGVGCGSWWWVRRSSAERVVLEVELERVRVGSRWRLVGAVVGSRGGCSAEVELWLPCQ